jgi:transposase-like protein
LANVIAELIPDAFHNTEQYANNRVECDHGRLKARLRPMRGLKTDRTASVIIRGHTFMQNLRRGTTNSALMRDTGGFVSPPHSMNSST